MEKHFIRNFHLELKYQKNFLNSDYDDNEQRVLKYLICSVSGRSGYFLKFNHPSKTTHIVSKSFRTTLRRAQNKRQFLKNQKDLHKNRQPGTNGIREYCGQYGLLEG